MLRLASAEYGLFDHEQLLANAGAEVFQIGKRIRNATYDLLFLPKCRYIFRCWNRCPHLVRSPQNFCPHRSRDLILSIAVTSDADERRRVY